MDESKRWHDWGCHQQVRSWSFLPANRRKPMQFWNVHFTIYARAWATFPPPDQLTSLICGGQRRVFINSLHCQLKVSLSARRPGAPNKVWARHSGAILQSRDVSFSDHVVSRLMSLSVQSCPFRSGATKSALLIINNLQINRTAYITSLAAPWSIPGMSLKLCLMNLNSMAAVWARRPTTHDHDAAFPHRRQGLNKNWKWWSEIRSDCTFQHDFTKKNPTNCLTAAPDAFPSAVPEIRHPSRGESCSSLSTHKSWPFWFWYAWSLLMYKREALTRSASSISGVCSDLL